MLDLQLVAHIKQGIETTLSPLPVSGISLVEGEDYDGNEVLFVTIDLPAGTGEVPGKIFLEAMNVVSEKLLESGDQRLPYFRTVRYGEAEPLDDEAQVLP